MPLNLTLAERIAKRSRPQSNGCIESAYSKGSGGYSHLGFQGRTLFVHRVAYELAHGPIPPGLTLDHLCRNRACCNPDHLEPVTNKENILRGTAPSAINARMTECRNGHPFVGVDSQGKRRCKTCRNTYVRERRAAGLPT